MNLLITCCRQICSCEIARDPQPSALCALLPAEASTSLTHALAEAGAAFHFGTTVSRVENDGQGVEVLLANGKRLKSDLVLSAIGVSPILSWRYALTFRVSVAF